MHKGSPVQDLNNYGVRMFGDVKGFCWWVLFVVGKYCMSYGESFGVLRLRREFCAQNSCNVNGLRWVHFTSGLWCWCFAKIWKSVGIAISADAAPKNKQFSMALVPLRHEDAPNKKMALYLSSTSGAGAQHSTKNKNRLAHGAEAAPKKNKQTNSTARTRSGDTMPNTKMPKTKKAKATKCRMHSVFRNLPVHRIHLTFCRFWLFGILAFWYSAFWHRTMPAPLNWFFGAAPSDFILQS